MGDWNGCWLLWLMLPETDASNDGSVRFYTNLEFSSSSLQYNTGGQQHALQTRPYKNLRIAQFYSPLSVSGGVASPIPPPPGGRAGAAPIAAGRRKKRRKRVRKEVPEGNKSSSCLPVSESCPTHPPTLCIIERRPLQHPLRSHAPSSRNNRPTTCPSAPAAPLAAVTRRCVLTQQRAYAFFLCARRRRQAHSLYSFGAREEKRVLPSFRSNLPFGALSKGGKPVPSSSLTTRTF